MLTGPEILTTAQMRAIESAAMQHGEVTGQMLMERAGSAVTGQIRLRWPKPGHAAILCGPGNNGGDGYVIARLLQHAGWRITVLGAACRPGSDAAAMQALWQARGRVSVLSAQALRSLPSPDLLVDAIFGTGLSRAPNGEIAAVLTALRYVTDDGRIPLVAVDCPSGLCLDTGRFPGGAAPLRADVTIAFDSPKPGHLLGKGPEACGKLIVVDIGLREQREAAQTRPVLSVIWPEFRIADRRTRPVRHALEGLGKASGDHHKFSHGHAVILAGPPGHGGAARLSARAALRIGAGLVTIAPPLAALIEHAQPPDALMRRGIDEPGELAEWLTDGRISSLCLGPGCGIDRAHMLLPPALACGRPLVLDADALTAVSRDATLAAALHPGCVLTPHAGEYARLFPDLADWLSRGDAVSVCSKLDATREAAKRVGATVLFKGPDTVIAAPDGQAMIHSAFDVPWLATAGAGDVLAGIIAGLLARGLTPLEAAGIGCLIHAKAARHHGPGPIADDLPDLIPAVLAAAGR
jgi:hydroxyethylthiazole kinase-like uncharacterized protein yjeF